MTGFGKGEARGKIGMAAVELRSVNHRYFEVQSHLPSQLASAEDRLRERLKRHLCRGRVNLSVTFRRAGGEAQAITIDAAVAKRYYRLLTRLKAALRLRGELSIDQLLALPKVIAVEEAPNQHAALLRLVEGALGKAVKMLLRMRQQEGKRLARDVLVHLQTIERALDHVAQRAPQLVLEHRERLTKRIQQLTSGIAVDRYRIETEIALFADTHDIAEEITRLRSHITSVRQTLADGAEAGRKLDFLAQELFREANTIGSKAADTAATSLVIVIKGAIEKIREQVQNIE